MPTWFHGAIIHGSPFKVLSVEVRLESLSGLDMIMCWIIAEYGKFEHLGSDQI